MKKFLFFLSFIFCVYQPVFAWDFFNPVENFLFNKDERAIRKVLNSQVKYANKNDFDKFISTYDEKYVNGDGFNLDIYSTLVKDLWNTYSGIKYGIQIKDVEIEGQEAKVELVETSYADLPATHAYKGELRSTANTIYSLKKNDGVWKVVSDIVTDETTYMMYGEARDLDVKLTVPLNVKSGTEYTATLEFVPPKETVAIASISADKVEYPQKPTQEVFRAMPDDNILERIFVSNQDKVNEYIVASIGLTKTSVTDLSLKLSLTGFGYTIRRVNVISEENNFNEKEQNVKN